MNVGWKRSWTRIAWGVVLAVALAAPASAVERGAADAEPAAEAKRLEPVGPWAYKRIGWVHAALAEDRYEDAKDALDELRRNTRLNARERALMWQGYGYLHSAQDDYKAAADAFAECLKADGLDTSATLQTRYNLAQIYVLLERPDEALREFDAWFAGAPNPSGAAYYLYAMAYVQKGDKGAALRQAERAVEKGGTDAKEPWLQLVSAIRLERKEYAEAIPVLERLIASFAKKTYWLQLSAVYSATNQPEKALAVLALAEEQGLLDQSNELLSLAQLYLYNQIPGKAAEVIDRGLQRGAIAGDARAYQLLADSLLHARERDRALMPLRRASELADNGNAALRLAQLHFEREEWTAASEELETAIAKGNLSSPGHAYLLLGIASANQKHWDEAERAFVSAQEYEVVQTVAAHWLKHLASQRGLAGDVGSKVAGHAPSGGAADRPSS